ncbi:MAG: flagellar hook-basal body complex protein [Betaproteobacteria bacterium]|nr:flagellar hook-basal body complex protein [Betaproteobacteria bacterium]
MVPAGYLPILRTKIRGTNESQMAVSDKKSSGRGGSSCIQNSVTASGALLQPAITIPNTASSVTFGRDGTVSIELAAGGSQVIGQIQLARFVNPSGLQGKGQNLMKETPASGAPQVLQPGVTGAGTLIQGTLEASNVNVVEEMVNMIETQRAYEINSKAISAVDGMLKFINNNL